MTRSKRKTRLPLRFSGNDNDVGMHHNNTAAETEGIHTHPSSAGISVGDIGFTLKISFKRCCILGQLSEFVLVLVR
jgi:hypothetical protein